VVETESAATVPQAIHSNPVHAKKNGGRFIGAARPIAYESRRNIEFRLQPFYKHFTDAPHAIAVYGSGHC
jgi:hypothetical protein